MRGYDSFKSVPVPRARADNIIFTTYAADIRKTRNKGCYRISAAILLAGQITQVRLHGRAAVPILFRDIKNMPVIMVAKICKS
jgi:hypothetical protein